MHCIRCIIPVQRQMCIIYSAYGPGRIGFKGHSAQGAVLRSPRSLLYVTFMMSLYQPVTRGLTRCLLT